MKNKLNKNFEIINTIQESLHYKKLVKPDEYVLLAISGGQDSICLLIIFYFLKTQWNLACGMVWCHHLWQKESFYTMLQLARLGFCLQLPTYFAITSSASSSHHVLTSPCPYPDILYSLREALYKELCPYPRRGYAKGTAAYSSFAYSYSREARVCEARVRSAPVGGDGDEDKGRLHSLKRPSRVKRWDGKGKKEVKTGQKMLTEKNARDWRHRINQRICFFYNYSFCTQGHNGSDRVETVLFNLMRGSGRNGVCALHWTKSRVPFSLNKFYCSESPEFTKTVNELKMKTKYYYQVKNILK
uniref:hypothetical chloroplast RF62 n=1 Tax=Watanabea sichuanensis TaxID=2704660 RepID=UPI00241167F1|nr:hypothetical chloroplast RF62 [Watanabea sichuanensis]WDY13175.1 hypothetical chloroplast RF62 [Watanabea sichuanensis]